jgi:hypothetical protein
MSTVISIIAVLVALYVGLMQWRTAHYRLSLDMFEKRYKVYEAVKNIINTVTLHGGVTPADLNAFYDSIRGAEFLFDNETRNFVMNIGQMSWRAKNARARRERSDHHPQTDKLIDEEENITKFLSEQDEGLEAFFRPYLDLSKVGLKSYWPGL